MQRKIRFLYPDCIFLGAVHFYFEGGKINGNAHCLMGIIVENLDSVEELNAILHQYGSYIIGRMGLPYRNAI